jgi:acetyltransferase-like isoleucine patch superfamily enzyme
MFMHARAFVESLRKRLTMAVLSHRVRARHPTLIAHPTAIWDYGFGDLDALEIGRDVSVGPFAEIIVYRRTRHSSVPGRLVLGDRSVISTGCDIRAAGGTIRIGEGSVVSQYNVLVAANHVIKPGEPRIHVRWDESERRGIDIGNNVWAGAHCVFLPGTVVGDDAVIAAGSVVRGTIPPGELWGGVPARKIRAIDGDAKGLARFASIDGDLVDEALAKEPKRSRL